MTDLFFKAKDRKTPVLDWGLYGVPSSQDVYLTVYQLYYGQEAILANDQLLLTMTNIFSDAGIKASPIAPDGGEIVCAAAPTFSWNIPTEESSDFRPIAFELEVKRNSSTGTSVLDRVFYVDPLRSSADTYSFSAPFYAYEKGTNYCWRIRPFDAKFSPASDNRLPPWSEWATFRYGADLAPSNWGFGAVSAKVFYVGAATGLLDRVLVQAFPTRGFDGYPVHQKRLDATQLISLTNRTGIALSLPGLLPSSPVSMRAFIDSNTNGMREAWESWGYAAAVSDGPDALPYDVAAILPSTKPAPSVWQIVIRDTDFDRDTYPDVWEFERSAMATNSLKLVGPAPTEPNPLLAR